MADNGGGSGFLGVIVGALLVAVVVLVGYVAFSGGLGGGQSADISIEAPEVPTGGG
jgi:hypothetical protein